MTPKTTSSRFIFTVLAGFVIAGNSIAADLVTDEEKTFYYLGTMLGGNLASFELTEQEQQLVLQGLQASMAGEAQQLDDQTYRMKLNEISQQRVAVAAAREAELSQAYVAEMAAEKGAITTPSGLVFLEITAGEGEQPTAESTVTAHYHGTLRDGTVFDSSVNRGQPLTIPLNRVIPCWTEAIAMMQVGGKARITCPARIAYGDRASGPIPPGSALTFEVELLGIQE